MRCRFLLLLMTLALLVGDLSAETLRFVCIADPQMEFTPNSPGLDKQFLELTIDEVCNLNPPAEFALILGDMVQSSSNADQWDDYFAAMDGMTIPYYEVMGNHDGWNCYYHY
jgi:hypothetical protein